ncbi:hypothetical protein LOTGIDRAFT_221353 [Lottia gigantea]|uniref:Sulfotransferase domain-containing protein n=1 Tax=Lottia gigantea TaxID=225164 RepID=V3ZRZ3_LOTGI|nr:hypothetical protein LOTGIDRAFT_221353 [Lottia gigantea]ESO85320.1 hypothetical protein LOTGIDRAFT_221353 [Lottia gigantea]
MYFYFFQNKLPFLEDVKNPCWYEGISVQKLKLRCLPYFVILGCAKCATTDLYSRLVEHQHILKNEAFMEKEALYWSWKKYGMISRILNFKSLPVESFEEFTSYFNPLSTSLTKLINEKSKLVHQLIIGDASPPDFWDFRAWPLLPQNDGLREPAVFTPHLMQYIYRNPKFILLFRNPTDRLYSDYFFLKQGNTPESFHEAVVTSIAAIHECLSSHSERYCFFSSKLFSKLKCRIHFGCYSIFLKEWFRVFKRDQFYIARTEDYSEDIETHIEQIFKFLEVEPISKSKMNKIESQKRSRVTKSKKRSSPMLLKTQKILDKFYERYNQQLAKLLQNANFVWSESNVFNQKQLKWDKT